MNAECLQMWKLKLEKLVIYGNCAIHHVDSFQKTCENQNQEETAGRWNSTHEIFLAPLSPLNECKVFSNVEIKARKTFIPFDVCFRKNCAKLSGVLLLCLVQIFEVFQPLYSWANSKHPQHHNIILLI